jgi:UDP-N-acetylmuramoyl-L-alanyl-D-glutamate--2,6-diaminopimelate ligase
MITFGKLATDIRIKRRRPNGEGQTLDIQVMGRDYSVQFPVIGDFQAQNAACALGLVIACGADPEQAVEALNGLSGVKGRIEKVAEHPNGAPVFIDYAHTPDALETLLRALKPHASNRLVVVFGCGGDRDQAKRPAMGSIACAYADHVIVTDDNPRNENAAAIRRSVMAGCDRAIEIRDRGEAIRAAVAGLNEGDALVVAGKGHEQGQIIRDEVRLFDDAEVARAAVAELGGYHL